jgi:hypothetical protein
MVQIPDLAVSGYRMPGLWWFRIFGYGLHFHDHRLHPPLFSESHGLGRKRFRIGSWCWSFLKP